MNVQQIKDRLVSEISKCKDVKGIAQTVDINVILVPGKSDIRGLLPYGKIVQRGDHPYLI